MSLAAGDPRRLNLQSILDEARAATGLIDIGEPDILPGMQVLIDSLINEAKLSANGIEGQRAGLISLISNRLRIEDTFRRHPEILDEKIRGPIVIVGLPRSGTTKLQRMMAAGNDFQTLPLWKILNPVPLISSQPDGEDPRIAIAEQMSAVMREHFPDFYAGHPMNAREPEEEVFMADLVMRGWNPSYMARTPSFGAWLVRQDFEVWYAYLRKLLQLFQWQDGSSIKPWLLKTPEHMPHISLLLKYFPGATIVHCHRDPIVTVASISALTYESRRMYSDSGVPMESGDFNLGHWADHTRRYMEQRLQLEKQHRFIDIAYAVITGDIMAAIERIYSTAGVTLATATRDVMRDWEAGNPPGKHGKHRYALESFGLSENEVRVAFAGYLQRFGGLIGKADG